MTPHLFVAPDGYGDPTIWRRDSDDDRLPQPILSRTAANARGFDALAALVEGAATNAETRPGAHPGETVCEGCIHGPACRVIPCVDCGRAWHLLGAIDNPFRCSRCEMTA